MTTSTTERRTAHHEAVRSPAPPARRDVTPGDEAFLRRLYASTRDDLAGIPGLDPTQLEVLVDLQFRAQRAEYRRVFPAASHQVVLVAGRPAGRLYLDRAPGVITVVDIALLPGFRGRGLGTELLGDLQAEAATTGSAIRLEARAGGRAEALYRRLGFAPLADPRPEGARGPGDGDVALEWRPENWLPIEVTAAPAGPGSSGSRPDPSGRRTPSSSRPSSGPPTGTGPTPTRCGAGRGPWPS